MSVAVLPVRETAARPPCPIYRFTVRQYHRMIETSILSENDRVELLEGWIVTKMPHNPAHDTTVDLTQTVITHMLPAGWRVRVQSAITTSDSEPEPDVAVVRDPARRYARSHPRPRDIALVIEVADTTLREDRNDKGRIYARARIPVYWIVNLQGCQIEIFTQPRAGRLPAYREQRNYGTKESVPLVIEGREVGKIPVSELLP